MSGGVACCPSVAESVEGEVRAGLISHHLKEEHVPGDGGAAAVVSAFGAGKCQILFMHCAISPHYSRLC